MDLSQTAGKDYELIDSGDGMRLERFGPYCLARLSPVALWARELPDRWDSADGRHTRQRSGAGRWEFARSISASWPIELGGLRLSVKPTSFGHVGLFPEHSCHWDWLQRAIGEKGARVLHLFAYTGAATLVAARAGAEVCHVDAVGDVNEWARENAERSGLSQAPIRWITDDVMKFVRREQRRGNRYDGVVLDPPSYGRGPKGEKWILEHDLAPLMALLPAILSEHPRFVLFTSHSPNFSPPLMRNMMQELTDRFGGSLECGTMSLRNPQRRYVLPCGFFGRWAGA